MITKKKIKLSLEPRERKKKSQILKPGKKKKLQTLKPREKKKKLKILTSHILVMNS